MLPKFPGSTSYRRQSEEEKTNSHKLNTFCLEVFVNRTGLGVAGGSVKINATHELEQKAVSYKCSPRRCHAKILHFQVWQPLSKRYISY